jgi:hypothetical protein
MSDDIKLVAERMRKRLSEVGRDIPMLDWNDPVVLVHLSVHVVTDRNLMETSIASGKYKKAMVAIKYGTNVAMNWIVEIIDRNPDERRIRVRFFDRYHEGDTKIEKGSEYELSFDQIISLRA